MRLHSAISICACPIIALAFVELPLQPRLSRTSRYEDVAAVLDTDTITELSGKDAKELVNTFVNPNQSLIQSIESAPSDRISLLLERKSLITRHPALAQDILQPSACVQSTDQWLFRYLNTSQSDTTKILSRWPNSEKQIRTIGRRRLHQWFAFFLSVGLTNTQLRRMIVSRPILLSYKLSNVQSTTSFFIQEVGLTNAEFRSIIKAYPSVLTYSIDKRLRPHIKFLQDEIGSGKDNWMAWKKVICSYPQFFSHSLEKTLLPKVEFFCDERVGALCLKKSELSQVVAKFPPVLWLSDANLEEKFEFLTKSLGLGKAELKEVIVQYPQVLGLSLEGNLKPKTAFFLAPQTVYADEDISDVQPESGCGMSKRDLKEFVLYQPALLAYSLQGRLKPRIRRLQENYISFRYCPKSIMSFTDEKFEKW